MRTLTIKEIENAAENVFKKEWDKPFIIDESIAKTKEFHNVMTNYFTAKPTVCFFDKDGNEINGKV